MTARLEGRRLRQEKLLKEKGEDIEVGAPSKRPDWWLHYSFPKEVLQISRPSTRGDSPNHQIFQLQEERRNSLVGDGNNKLRRSRESSSKDLFKLETHASNLNDSKSLDSLGALRAHVNSHPGREARERERKQSQEFNGFQFPDDLARGDGMILRNGLSTNQNILLNGSAFIPNGALLASPNRIIEGGQRPHVNGFEEDIEDDITKMAAQRDQQRGSKRYIRGMMAPVTSKDDDSRKLNTARRLSMMKQRSESMLDLSEENSRAYSDAEQGKSFPDGISADSINVHKLKSGGENKGPRKRRPSGTFLEDFGSRDIMAQSIMRQTLRGSKQNIFDNNSSNNESFNGIGLGTNSSSDFTIFHSDNKINSLSERNSGNRRTSCSGEITNTHDDVQILNLQGFMDSALRGQTAGPSRNEHKHKSRRRQIRRLEEVNSFDASKKGSRSRQKKKSKPIKGNSMGVDDNDEVVLKDIDDMDEKMASLVVGPKQPFKDSIGRPITLEEAIQLRQILTGSPSSALPKEWLDQNFIQNKNPNLSYGLVQKKGGPCGVLASVQAHMIKSLVFGSRLSPTTSPASPLRPSTREWAWALSIGLTEILWRMSDTQKVILALPGSLSSHFDYGIGRYFPDGLTETLALHEFTSEDSLFSAIESHLQVFTSNATSGCVLLLYSALLTRGLETVSVDMDNGGGFLINAHGYASQEVVNLLLTGQATTNTFDGDQTLGDEGISNDKTYSIDSAMENFENKRRGSEAGENKLVLRGIRKRSEIGLLSLFEHYGSCKVGSHLKSPEYPVWVVCSESHYSVAFARDQYIARDDLHQDPFDIYYYDGLALQEDEIRLTIDSRNEPLKSGLVPPLELCLRTKWPIAHISWNGTDPIL